MHSDEKVNILLVDDQPAKLLAYEVILKELGENLVVASSGREALEYLLKNEVAVILVDVCMPELDGFELARMIHDHPRFRKTAIIFVSAVQVTDVDRLRGYETIEQIRHGGQFRRLPIVALTAKAMKGDREKCLEAGASDYLAKPVNTEQLLTVLRMWLHR